MRTVALARWVAVCFIGSSALPQVSDAQGTEDRERGAVNFGAFFTEPLTSARLDSDTSEGTDVQFEDDLGFETSTTVARIGGYLWIQPRQRLDFSYFKFARDGTRAIDETIDFGDQTFQINTVVSSSQDVTVLKADYTFAPIMKQRGFFGITGGLYVAQTKLSMSEPTVGAAESEDLTAPLPVIGFRGDYGITDRITLRGAVEWFSIDTGDVEGSLRDTYIGADYAITDRLSLGLAYNDVGMAIRASEGGGFNGALDWGYDGFLLYMNMDFGSAPD